MKIKAEVPPGYEKIESGTLRDSDLVYVESNLTWRHPRQNETDLIGRDIKDYYGVCRKIDGKEMATIKDYDGSKVFVHKVGDYEYSFNVYSFPLEKHDWLCKVVGKHMDEIHERATTKADELAKARIREALGL